MTHTPVGVLGGLAASIDTQIGKQPALIPAKFSPFFTKLRMCFISRLRTDLAVGELPPSFAGIAAAISEREEGDHRLGAPVVYNLLKAPLPLYPHTSRFVGGEFIALVTGTEVAALGVGTQAISAAVSIFSTFINIFTVLCDGVLSLALLTLTPVRAHRVHTCPSPTHSRDSNTLIHILTGVCL